MTSTFDPLQLSGADDPAAVLAHARAQKAGRGRRRPEVLRRPRGGRRCTPRTRWSGRSMGGTSPACRWVGRGARRWRSSRSIEFAAALGRSTESGRRYLSHAVEGHYRLPRCWARVEAGELPAWRLAFIADRTMCLSPAAAGVRGRQVAPFAHKIGPAQLGRLIEEAKARFDPEADRGRRRAAAEARHFDIALADATRRRDGAVDGEVDLADALDLEAAIAAGAHQQLAPRLDRAPGRAPRHRRRPPRPRPTDPRPRRRRAAPAEPSRQRGRWCCTSTSSTPRSSAPGGLARLHEVPGPVTAEQVRLVRQPRHPGHDPAGPGPRRPPPHRLLRSLRPAQAPDPAPRHTCAFPFCSRPAERCDCDHRVPPRPRPRRRRPDLHLQPRPLRRRHHRAKTTGGWTYLTVEPGTYLWHSPLGYQFLRDHTGTLDITPDPERQRLAHDFRAHFGPPTPTPTPNPDHPAPPPAHAPGARGHRRAFERGCRHQEGEPGAPSASPIPGSPHAGIRGFPWR